MALSPPTVPRLTLSSPSHHHASPLRTSLTLTLTLTRRPKPLAAVPLGHVVEENSIGDHFFEAVEELQRMSRDASDVLGEMSERLSARELQLVLIYFSQEGRDSYCALEVFDWLRRENRVDGDTRELMVSIACGWIERLVDGGHAVGDVVGLLDEIECVGLEVGFRLEEKVVSMYWERGRREEAVGFVRDFVGRKGRGPRKEDVNGGLLGYLAWKMMFDGKYMDAVKLVIEFKERELKPGVYSYLIALTALVKEQKEFSKNLRSLLASVKKGLVGELNKEHWTLIQKHQSDILKKGKLLSRWALQKGSTKVSGIVHEKLLALYACAGHGLGAENQLWEMKLAGKEPDKKLYNIVLAICASQNKDGSVRRLLAGIEGTSAGGRRKALQWLLRGYVKGGHYSKASDTLLEMLDLGFCPNYLDRAAVLRGLRKGIIKSGSPEAYLNLCKRLSDLDLIGPCLIYLHMRRYNMWVMKAL